MGKTRRRVAIALLLGFAVLVSACMFLPDFVGQLSAGKYDPAAETPRPQGTATTPLAEVQTEPHTCGLHAMRSMYAAYGLDLEPFRLRFRLGTDQPAMRADKESTGTLHPDLYRVLAQDGFKATPVDLDDVSAERVVQAHLDGRQLALAVVYRSTYHWVLLGPSDKPGELVVYDSLLDEPSAQTTAVFLQGALSITVVQPGEPGDVVSATDAHAEGLAEMARLYRRKK